MCEYAPACTKNDHPLAAGLWERKRQGTWLVLCPRRYCPIGVVFDLPGRERVLCCPSYLVVRRSVFADPQPDGTPLEDPDELGHFHATVRPLKDYADDEGETGKCRCGTWGYTPATMNPADWSPGPHNDRPYVLASYVMTAQETAKWRADKAAFEARDSE